VTTFNKLEGYYFTANSDGNRIERDAHIQWAQSWPEMIERLQDCNLSRVVSAQAGDFGDCYAKFPRKVDEHLKTILAAEIPLADEDDFIVRRPGSHPGGHFWWVDFVHPVYVAVYDGETDQ
jgi:hypothetical protein